ncbi:unnamed protein product [Protopolystoma xenopodis]|uniref:Uncharacterized protein n=1 Tax=Protopolystoma xenopodis TaxID=117903 RepID=A0A3S5A353_9PLAT|nr:unnamed protein product [Protopolystoma xenopodis]
MGRIPSRLTKKCPVFFVVTGFPARRPTRSVGPRAKNALQQDPNSTLPARLLRFNSSAASLGHCLNGCEYLRAVTMPTGASTGSLDSAKPRGAADASTSGSRRSPASSSQDAFSRQTELKRVVGRNANVPASAAAGKEARKPSSKSFRLRHFSQEQKQQQRDSDSRNHVPASGFQERRRLRDE